MSEQIWDGNERRKSEWKVDKHISWGHILTTLAMIVSAITWGNKIDSRVELNAREIEHVSKEQDKESVRLDNVRLEIKGDLRMINDKLDRLISNSSNK